MLNCLKHKNPRLEKKFYISGLMYHDIEATIKYNRGVFSEVFYPRYVNSLYIDYPNMENYWDNVIGYHSRLKIRIRWYGELTGSIKKPVLELKIKEGLIGWKDSYPFPPFTIGQGFEYDDMLKIIKNSDLPLELKLAIKSSEPTLLVRYKRKYYMSSDSSFRITLDSEMQYTNIGRHNNSFARQTINYTDSILELKYAPDLESRAELISNDFPFRVTKSSKYVDGINALDLW